jgi:hypothetical protein
VKQHTGMAAHDGYAPHSHEIRRDHRGVPRVEPAPAGTVPAEVTGQLTPEDHVAEAERLLHQADGILRGGTPRGLLELGLAALAHSVTALAAREFPPEGGSAGDLPDGREDLRPGTPAQPYSLGASILAWLGNKDAADTPDGLTARALAKLTGHPGGDVQAELRSLEGNHLVRRNVQDKVARWSLIPAAGQGQAS